MAEFEKEDFKFPDEDQGKPEEKLELEIEGAEDAKLQVEIEDDTPEEDRGRERVAKEVVQKLELETDELDKYSKEAKEKLIKMKRVWHDERRAKEEADRERQEAIVLAQKLFEENKRIKGMLESGEKEYKEAKKDSAKSALKAAKQAYKEAYESGDAERIMEAQEEMMKAQLDLDKAKKFKLPPLQEENFAVQQQYQAQPAPQPDHRVMEWQAENPWFGQDEEMTAAALGLHEKMARNGVKIGSDEYYETLDKTIRKRFPENFEQEADAEPKTEIKEKAVEAKQKPSTVVAPATRSTAPNRIRLKASQVQLAKKLGLTPEQYALELRKLEAR
jgi:hypothetical protein